MNPVYHSGELKVQTQAGAAETAINVSRVIYPVIAHVFIDFIQSRPMVVLGSIDDDGMTWTSILYGPPEFMQVMDEHTLRIAVLPHVSDPLCGNLRDGAQVGLLLMDFATRRRLRLNGSVIKGADGFSVLTRQVYVNCPRYIQSRRCKMSSEVSPSMRVARQALSLSGDLQQRIGQADTFFLASFHPLGGADASHRGGFPGFVQAVDERTLVWPDYNGNGMFNTLGNIAENPNAGLLFLDFERGGTLQLSGTAQIVWDRERAESFPGAERLIEFNVLKVIETENATPLRWTFVEYSPDNPWFF